MPLAWMAVVAASEKRRGGSFVVVGGALTVAGLGWREALEGVAEDACGVLVEEGVRLW